MANPRGEHLRNAHLRVALHAADQATLKARSANDPSRSDGALTALADYSLWMFDADSVAPAAATVLVPNSGTGRWHCLIPAGGLSGTSYKAPVRLATAGALPAYARVGNVITGAAPGALGNVDGVAVVAGDRLLLTSDGTASDVDNGIYVATSIGGATAYVLTRADDANATGEIVGGMLVPVQAGATHTGDLFICTNTTSVTVNTTAITFAKVPEPSEISSLETRLSSEECARSDTDSSVASIETRLSSEECARSDTDSSLASVETRLSAEECARSDTDSSLTSVETRLSSEECARSDTDSSLASVETRLSTEECARSDTDSSVASVETRLSTEECARSDTDSSLASVETRLSTEECARSDTDSSLASVETRLSTEECARSDTDSSVASIETRLSSEECARSDTDSSVASIETRVSTEECTRSTADSSLDARLDTLTPGRMGFGVFGFREVDGNGDVTNLAGHGGILASDSTPALDADANHAQLLRWIAGNNNTVAENRPCPKDFDGSADVTVRLWVASGATDPATINIWTSWDGAAQVVDSAVDGAPSAVVHEITATIAAADVPDSPSYVSIEIAPGVHATDPVVFYGLVLEHASKSA